MNMQAQGQTSLADEEATRRLDPTGVQAIMLLDDEELRILAHHYAIEAGRCGFNASTGVIESPPKYEFAVKRGRQIEETLETIAASRALAREQAAEAA